MTKRQAKKIDRRLSSRLCDKLLSPYKLSTLVKAIRKQFYSDVYRVSIVKGNTLIYHYKYKSITYNYESACIFNARERKRMCKTKKWTGNFPWINHPSSSVV